MSTAADALAQYEAGAPFPLLNVVEDPRGSNLSPIGEEFGWNGVPWCCETVSVALTRVGIPLHEASCWWAQQRYKDGSVGTWLGKPADVSGIAVGDQAFYGYVGSDHTGIVKEIDVEGGRFYAYEGNYGDACVGVWRSFSDRYVYAFGRPAYSDAVAPDSPAPEPPPVEAPASPPPAGDAPGFPLPDGWYFGPRSGPQESVSGYFGHGEDLAVWQQRMIDRGWNLGPSGADGRYGPDTQRVAANFQAEKGLEQDGGKIGPETWGAAWTAPLT